MFNAARRRLPRFNRAARFLLERALRNPRTAEIVKIRENLEAHRRAKLDKFQNHAVEMVLKAIEEGQVQSKKQVQEMLAEIEVRMRQQYGNGVDLEYRKLFPGFMGRDIESYFTRFYHTGRGVLR